MSESNTELPGEPIAAFQSEDTLTTVVSSSRELTKTDGNDDEDRGHWGNRAEFLLSCIGLSVGLGNVWRFPVLAFENGGAAFLIPYIILQLLIGKPMYFMELMMGQFSGLGPTAVWRMNPAGKGIGISMLVISIIVAIYYNVIMAYTLYYFFASMQTTLPWTNCKPEWISRYCTLYIGTGDKMPNCDASTANASIFCKCSGVVEYDFNQTSDCFNYGITNYSYFKEMASNSTCSDLAVCTNDTKSAAHFYFYEEVIRRSDSIGEMGDPIWYLSLCLLLSWLIVVLCLIKGVKSSGKVVYFTATFPYVILLVLLIGGAVQDGALEGVKYFLIPDWHKLLNIEVWRQAAGQMFFSLSVSFGGIIMFGSYNKFRHNVYVDALIISTMDLVTSFIAGLVIFTTLGAMSNKSGVPIESVAQKGYGLAFVAYPEALLQLPVPHLWSILFFFMLFTLGLDSEFALLETVLTCLKDEFPRFRKKNWLLCITTGIVFYAITIPLICPGGDWVLSLLDFYGSSFAVLLVAFCEVIAVNWVYRVDRFMMDVKYCLGYSPHPQIYWYFCWTISSPLLIGGIFVLAMINYRPLEYADKTPYEDWAQGLGWMVALVALLPIPIVFIWAMLQQSGTFLERLKAANSPTKQWGPQPHNDNTWRSPHERQDSVTESQDHTPSNTLQPSKPISLQTYDNMAFEDSSTRL